MLLSAVSSASAMPPRKHHHVRRHDVGVHPAGEQALAYARHLLGVPYSYGGASRSGVDCSGLTMLAWRAAGVRLPHSSYSQWSLGRHVSRRHLEPGDVVFFEGLGHVGLYAGHGRFIHAPHTGTRVRVDRLWAPGYGDRYAGAVRP